MDKRSRQRAFLAMMVAGVLLVPALAAASTAVFGGRSETASTTDTSVVATAGSSTVAVANAGTDGIDPRTLAAACGPDVRDLLDRESAGTLTPIEQAALDALRPICADAGLPLPDPPVVEPVVIVETVSAQAATGSSSRREHDDDDEGYEEHEKKEREKEHDDDD